jgi:uncharacterized protein (TIGR00725 family)
MIRTRRIIAVFGGSGAPSGEVLACAKNLGHIINLKGHVLLTGGTGPGVTSVKEIAIEGAGSERWVGVDPSGPDRPEERDGGLVVRTGLGHKRNYLEACLCDAAIALPGKDGTVSEVTSSLSLDRPVAFVGEWRTDVDLDSLDRSSVLRNIVQRTRTRFGNGTGTDEITPLIAEGALLRALRELPPYRYFELCDAEAAVEWVESVVPAPPPFAGAFPGWSAFDDVRPVYERWIEEHGA